MDVHKYIQVGAKTRTRRNASPNGWKTPMFALIDLYKYFITTFQILYIDTIYYDDIMYKI
jgi:hypothetical protein